MHRILLNLIMIIMMHGIIKVVASVVKYFYSPFIICLVSKEFLNTQSIDFDFDFTHA